MARRTGPRKRTGKNGSASEQRPVKRSSTRTSRNTEQARRQRAMRRKRQLFLFRLICGLLICAVVVLAPTVFFRVSQVHIVGDTRYDTEELITASGVREGDNMFFLDSGRIESTLQDMYPYLDTVTIKRKFPSTLNIEVTERVAALSVERGGKYLLMDMTGKALELTDDAAADTVKVIGVKAEDLTVGETITEQDEKLIAVIDLMELMTQYGMNTEVRAVDIEKAFEVKMQYADRYTVLLGDLSNLEHKIQFLQAILKEPSLPESGIIDLTDDKKAHYRPGDVMSTESEGEDTSEEEPAEDEIPEETVPEDDGTEPDGTTDEQPDDTDEQPDDSDDTTPTEEDPALQMDMQTAAAIRRKEIS